MKRVKLDAQTYQEAEANQFALELLMPEEFVRAEVAKLKSRDITDDRFIKLLASKFQVPMSVMAIRLGQLMPEPNPPF